MSNMDADAQASDLNRVTSRIDPRAAPPRTLDQPTSRIDPGSRSSSPLLGGRSVSELEQYVRDTYGYMAGFLDIPELRMVLLTAAREGWNEQRLYGALTKTSWWQTTSSSARQWTQLMAEDPATAQQMAAQNAATISDAAARYGLTLSPAQIGQLSIDAAKYGWSNEQTIDSILRNVNWSNIAGGDLTAQRDAVQAMGHDYLVRVSKQTASEWALRIAKGEMTEDGVRSILQAQARSRYSYMGDLIDQGITPADYFAPVRSTVASTLEIGEDAIDMMDPTWMRMLEVRDPKTNELRAATLNEAMLSARADPRWANTQNAEELSARATIGLANAFGRR